MGRTQVSVNNIATQSRSHIHGTEITGVQKGIKEEAAPRPPLSLGQPLPLFCVPARVSLYTFHTNRHI